MLAAFRGTMRPLDRQFEAFHATWAAEPGPDSGRPSDQAVPDLANAKHPSAGWARHPLFFDADEAARIDEDTRILREEILRLPRSWFAGDERRVAEFYDLPLESAKSAIAFLEDSACRATVVGRGDYALTGKGLRCLELNVATFLGGWEAANRATSQLQDPLTRAFAASIRATPSFRDPLQSAIRAVASAAGRRGLLDDPRLVIALSTMDVDVGGALPWLPVLERLFQASVEKAGSSSRVEVRVVQGAHANGTTMADAEGRRVHVLLEFTEAGASPGCLDLASSGRVLVYDSGGGPIGRILGDKRNLALLRMRLSAGVLAEHVARRIESLVPWTCLFSDPDVVFNGRHSTARDLLLGEQGRFVLKKARSLGGKGVFLGESTTPERWRELVTSPEDPSDPWVAQEVQEFVPHVNDLGEGLRACDAVWGVFDVGDGFAGSIVRLQPKAERRSVINVAQGAVRCLALELVPH